MQILLSAALAGAATLGMARAATDVASVDPILNGALAAPATQQALPAHGQNIDFTVVIQGTPLLFPASLSYHRHNISGSVTSPTGCPGTVNEGSTDMRAKLYLEVTFNGKCNGLLGVFSGTLKFEEGTGAGTFSDQAFDGPYTAAKAKR